MFCFVLFPISINKSGQILEQSHREAVKSPILKVFKIEQNNFSEQLDLIRSALGKGLEQTGTLEVPSNFKYATNLNFINILIL